MSIVSSGWCYAYKYIFIDGDSCSGYDEIREKVEDAILLVMKNIKNDENGTLASMLRDSKINSLLDA